MSELRKRAKARTGAGLCFYAMARARDIERESRGVRDIEAFDLARKIKAREAVAGLAGQLPQALAFGAEHQRKRRAKFDRREIVGRAAVQADDEEAAFLQCGERARQILHDGDRHQFERARGGLCQHAGRLGAVARGGDDRRDREGRGRPQDRADIVRIGDLVEDEHDAGIGEIVDAGRGQRIGFGEKPLCTASGVSRAAMASGRTTSGASGGVMFSSAKRRSAFSVANRRRMRRAGLASAAVTVCQPYRITSSDAPRGRSRRPVCRRSSRCRARGFACHSRSRMSGFCHAAASKAIIGSAGFA